MITIKIAGLPIGIDNKYPRVELMSKDYLTDEEPLFVVSVDEDDIKQEKINTSTEYPISYYESIIAYRKISEKLPEYDAFLFHGSVIELNGQAYIITAHSGVGKTTHTRLWMSEFAGEAEVLNGDKPIIRIVDGVAYACGTPWQGKENYGKNMMCPVAGFAFLSRAEKNRASVIDTADAVIRFMSQIYLPKKSKVMLAKTLTLADKVLKSARLVHLECNMEPEAAHVCRGALVDEK